MILSTSNEQAELEREVSLVDPLADRFADLLPAWWEFGISDGLRSPDEAAIDRLSADPVVEE